MITIAVACQKGGVGKTSTCLSLGAGLSSRGRRVLFVDLDAQGNLTYSLKGQDGGGDVFAALQRPESVAAEVRRMDGFDLLASVPSLSSADVFFTETGREYRLLKALQTLEKAYDFCIVDTPPSLGILTVNALTACRYAIVPTQADVYSLHGIGQLAKTVSAVREFCNPNLSLMGVLVTRFNARTVVRREVVDLLDKTATKLGTTVFKSKVRECVAMVEAQAVQQSIFSYAPKCNAASDYSAFVDEVLELVDRGGGSDNG